MGVCETLEFKYTVEFSSHKKKLIKKIIISKGTRNSFLLMNLGYGTFQQKQLTPLTPDRICLTI